MNKPIAESCIRNQSAILNAIHPYLSAPEIKVLEIGSGTGQHAFYFASRLANVLWQPSDLAAALPGIQAWVDDSSLSNLCQPLLLDVGDCEHWLTSDGLYGAVFTANTIHYVSIETASSLLSVASKALEVDGLFFVYGAFNDNGEYTSEGNYRLDEWLKSRDPLSGLKDVGWLKSIARLERLIFEKEIQMPANNLLLVFRKDGSHAEHLGR